MDNRPVTRPLPVNMLLVLWALPWSLTGLAVGTVGLLIGGRARYRKGVLEFWGGPVTWLLRHVPFMPFGARAMTLGHTVLGQSPEDLDCCREHELVHVRQYERWGPLFIPAYLLLSGLLLLRGKDVYYDNPFEQQAFEETTN